LGAIILAAGRGERLNGIAAPYMKPALLVNGVPLIVQQVRNALELSIGFTTLVLAPENARMMIDLITHGVPELDWDRVDVVMQPQAGTSVVDALKRGLRLHMLPTVVLMGDNVVPQSTVHRMMEHFEAMRPDLLVATRQMSWHDAQRFTYRSAGIWFEKELAAVAMEGENEAEVWVGPLIIRSPDEMYAVLGHEESIGRTFNAFTRVDTFEAECSDIGVPEAVQ
jgi:CTP:molybdopterin cytidylyltransferase MocA